MPIVGSLSLSKGRLLTRTNNEHSGRTKLAAKDWLTLQKVKMTWDLKVINNTSRLCIAMYLVFITPTIASAIKKARVLKVQQQDISSKDSDNDFEIGDKENEVCYSNVCNVLIGLQCLTIKFFGFCLHSLQYYNVLYLQARRQLFYNGTAKHGTIGSIFSNNLWTVAKAGI